LAGILLASGGDPADIPNTTQCREWGYGKYTERDLLAAILLATGGGGGAVWGSITGTLSDQTDLNTALGAKLNLTGGTLTGGLSFSGTTHAGLRLNNLTTAERNAVASPQAGMVLWNTTTSRMDIHNGSAWTDGFVRLAGDTMTGALVNSTNGAASTPPLHLTGTWFTGGSTTTTKPQLLIEPTGATSTAWSTNGTGIGVNAATGFVGNLLDLQLNGVARLSYSASNSTLNIPIIGSNTGLAMGNTFGVLGAKGVLIRSDLYLGWTNGTTDIAAATVDVFLRRRSPAYLQLGVDSATPVSQSLGVNSGSGTNIAGANFTISAGTGTGTGTPGQLLFQTSTTTGSGATAQTLTTRVTINSADVVIASGIALQLGNAAVAATPTPTHTLTVKDSTGTTYRIPCVV
jgi:hypothetical protein